MAEPGGGADLAQEALLDARAVEEVAVDHLEDGRAVHDAVAGQVGDAHAAAAQLVEHFVLRVVT
jgi:hypothetical protein